MKEKDDPNGQLQAAHTHSTRHRNEIVASEQCACFYCCKFFKPNEISEWIDDDTARCPQCGIDSVLGSASGFDLTQEFIESMHKYWF